MRLFGLLPFVLTLLFKFTCLSAFSLNKDAELIYQQTDVFLKNGKLIKNLTYEIKIINREGERFTKVTIPYSSLSKITKLEACIKDQNGIIIKKLQKNDLTDRNAISESSFYEDYFVREFTLKHVSYPYIIVYSYQLIQEEFLQIDYWMPVIDLKVPTLKAVLNIEVPANYKLLHKSWLVDNIHVDTAELFTRYSWSTSFVNTFDPELLSPPISTLVPLVIVEPYSFLYDERGSFESWSTFGEWNNQLLNGLSDLPQSEKNIILNITEGLTDVKEKIKKLYNYLQDQTRYINVSVETGGFKPYPASYVAYNKYGDCKALSNYFMAMLEVAGIYSYYTKVNAGDPKIPIDKQFPSQQFNHIILCIPVQNDTIWLDCTSNGPFGYLGTFTQDRDVLIIDKKGSHFSRTPALSFEDVKEARKVEIRHDFQNQALATFTNTYKGEKYEALYFLSSSVSGTDKIRVLKDSFVEEGFDLTDFNLSAPCRDSSEIIFKYSAESGILYKVYGNDLLIDVIPFDIPAFEDPKNRKLPVQIDYPVFKTDTLEYEIPEGYFVNSILYTAPVISPYGKYEILSVLNGNKVSVIKSFMLFPGLYSKEQYEDFYKFINKVIDIEQGNKIVATKNL